jgi:uncharacterized protein with NAD-binding domain and iron-sulfur cluster
MTYKLPWQRDAEEEVSLLRTSTHAEQAYTKDVLARRMAAEVKSMALSSRVPPQYAPADPFANAWPSSMVNAQSGQGVSSAFGGSSSGRNRPVSPLLLQITTDDLDHPVFAMDEATLADLWSARFADSWVQDDTLDRQEDTQFWRLAHKRLFETFRRLEKAYLMDRNLNVWRLLPKAP